MKKLRACLLIALTAFAINADAVTIDLTPSQDSVGAGNFVSIAVSVQDLVQGSAPSVGVYDMDVHFDSELFSYSELIWGNQQHGNQLDINGNGTLGSSDLKEGFINVFELSLDDATSLDGAQLADFTLFTIIFKALDIDMKNVKTGQFFIGNYLLGDAYANPLMVTTINSTEVMVINKTVPEPASALLLLGLLSIIALRSQIHQKRR